MAGGGPRLTAQEAWLAAARDVDVDAKAAGISVRGSRAGFGQLRVAGLATPPPCTLDERQTSAATPHPWDVIAGAAPTFTTTGNNADAGLSALSPLTPGPDRVRPTGLTREYDAPFTNQWQGAKCDPSVFAGPPAATGGTDRNDINAAIYSLFSNHNNMHDWAYDLGFTEANFNMQVNNFGKGGQGGDAEIGNAQGGALAGGFPSYTGRTTGSPPTATARRARWASPTPTSPRSST